ncbi:glutathione S-transferase [Lentinula aff. detonsa]|uniref:glutathione transferase n=1 Tax=Lentinula aff. detonsa TaxID=2804958 RepID=A0AA38NSJ2_9AGAR|nr:glutathione S-transferase [Lentinula aff. detonsa]KAJ3793933.1 glutathione S-transferase [Lentinula aff. detonsa]
MTALDPVSLTQLNDALFDFRSVSPVQCLVGSGFGSLPQDRPILRLYGSSRCCSTARIAVVLHEKQIGYELYPLQPTAYRMCLRHLPISTYTYQPPDHQDDGGIILHGCRNVCQYLATRYPDQGTRLIPDSNDTRSTELFGQAKFTESQSFEPLARNALYETLMKRQQGFVPTDAIGSSALQELSNIADGYEFILSRQKYLAGNDISLVDLYHLPYGEMLCSVEIDVLLTKSPNVSRWWADISSRPSWLAIRDGVPSKG